MQRRLAAARARARCPTCVWVLEHPPTYTAGRHGRRDDLHLSDAALAGAGAEFVEVDRGGQMTWHGPGQSVVYAICDLRPGRRVRAFVEAMVGAMATRRRSLPRPRRATTRWASTPAGASSGASASG